MLINKSSTSWPQRQHASRAKGCGRGGGDGCGAGAVVASCVQRRAAALAASRVHGQGRKAKLKNTKPTALESQAHVTLTENLQQK